MEGRKDGRTERRKDGRCAALPRHPERSEGPCEAELELRVRRSLAPLGMTRLRHSAASRASLGLSLFPSFRLSVHLPPPLPFPLHVPTAHPEVSSPRLRILGPGLAGGVRDHPRVRERFPGVPPGHWPDPLGLVTAWRRAGLDGLAGRRAPELGR